MLCTSGNPRLALLVIVAFFAACPLRAMADQPAQGSTAEGVQSSDQIRSPEHLRQAEELFMRGQYAEASEQFALASTFDPDDPRDPLFQVFCQFALGDFGAAATLAHDVMNTWPDLAGSIINIREMLGETETFDRRMGELPMIVNMQNDSSQMRFLQGFIQYYTGDPVAGAQTLAIYLDNNPEDSTIRPFVVTAEDVVQLPPKSMRLPPSSGRGRTKKPSATRTQPQAAMPPAGQPTQRYAGRGPSMPTRTNQAAPPVQQRPVQQRPPRQPPPRPVPQAPPPEPEVQRESGPDIAGIAISEFCRARGLDPVDNRVAANVTKEKYDEDDGTTTYKVHIDWVEWKTKEDKGVLVRRSKQKDENVELEFDRHGRLIDFDD